MIAAVKNRSVRSAAGKHKVLDYAGRFAANRSAPLGMTSSEKFQLRFCLLRDGNIPACAIVVAHAVLLPQA
jgi:hypothetical protein